jgi:hypothetical protein
MTNTQPPSLPPALPAPAGASGTPATPGGPLTGEHLQTLTLADQRAKKLRSAAGLAKFNGITIGTFGALSLMIVVGEMMFGELDWLGTIMGIGLAVISWNEFRGRKLLQQFNARAPAVLGWNQLGLLALVVGYAVWMICAGFKVANPDEERMLKELAGTPMESLANLPKMLASVMYRALIVITVMFQGLNSLYYFTRARILRDYLAQTPAWVVELQRHQAGGR